MNYKGKWKVNMQTTGTQNWWLLWSNEGDAFACRFCLRSHIWPLAETPSWKSTGQQSQRDNWPQSPSDLKNPSSVWPGDKQTCKEALLCFYVSGHWAVWSLKRFALLQKAAPLNLLPKRIKMQFVVPNLPWKRIEASWCYLSGKIRHKPSALSSETFFLISFTQVLSPSAERHFPAYKATCPCGQSPHSIPPQRQTADYLVSKNELCCKQHCDNLIICQSIEPVIMKCISEFKGKGRRKLKFICWQRKLSN